MKPRRSQLIAGSLSVLAGVSAASPARAQETWGKTTSWLPENQFVGAEPLDTMFNFILYLTGGTLIAVFACLIVFLVRYRHRPGQRAVYIHGNPKLEIVWTLIPTVIMALIAAFSQNMWADMKSPQRMKDLDNPVRVDVAAKQFEWHFRYPGPDGTFGKTHILWRNDDTGSDGHFGLMRGDPEEFMDPDLFETLQNDPDRAHLLEPDPHAVDDICVPRLFVPVGRPIHVTLTSRDVLHSFFLKEFRVKQDIVPGMTTHVWFQARKTSEQVIGREASGEPKPFDIICAELCGQGHYTMRGQMFVISQPKFDTWLTDNTPEFEEYDEEEEE